MASVVDEIFYRNGTIDPDFIGVNQAKAGDLVLDRDRGEPEAAFLIRAKREATAAGYRVLRIAGHLQIGGGR